MGSLPELHNLSLLPLNHPSLPLSSTRPFPFPTSPSTYIHLVPPSLLLTRLLLHLQGWALTQRRQNESSNRLLILRLALKHEGAIQRQHRIQTISGVYGTILFLYRGDVEDGQHLHD